MNKTITFLLTVVLFLQACTYGGYNPKLDFKLKNNDDVSQKSIIIFKMPPVNNLGQIVWQNAETKELIYTSEYNPYSGFIKTLAMLPITIIVGVVTFGTILLYGKKHYRPIEGNQYIALQVPAGKYFLKEITTINNINQKVEKETFEIKQGEMLYLGDLSFYPKKGIFSITACVNSEDNMKNVDEFVKSKYPQLEGKEIKKSLIVHSALECMTKN